MSKTTIDWTIWATATQLAKELTHSGKPTTPQAINNWKRRGLVKFERFPGLDKDLIKRGTINVKGYK